MKWRGRTRSKNVQDHRGRLGTPRRKVAAGGGLIVLVVAVVAILMGQDPSFLLKMLGQAQAGGASTQHQEPETRQVQVNPEHEHLVEFVSVVLKDTEDVWHELLDDGSQRYREPTLRLFSAGVPIETGGCGVQGSEVGPFYCSGDSTIYLELGFFELLEKKLGAKGDFARAYVIAHEVGHHIQNLTGQSREVHAQQQRLSKADANLLSVRLELQADYLAGVFAHHAEARGLLDPGDVDEALNAASQIGDDALQKRATGRVGRAESFTHGTSAQRVRWFRKGYLSGNPQGMFETFEIPAGQL